MKPDEPATLCCPTCGVSQVWSDTCRRCRSDLGLLHQTLRHAQRLRQRCLAEFATGRYDAAARTARHCCRLNPDQDNRRLLAMAEFLRGRFAAAVHVACLQMPVESR